jgi:hypothetical protein
MKVGGEGGTIYGEMYTMAMVWKGIIIGAIPANTKGSDPPFTSRDSSAGISAISHGILGWTSN